MMLLLLVVSSSVLTSCKDDDSASGTPEITGVRVTDPTKADSLFTKSSANSMIAIMGNNLAGATAVYINDQSVYLNSTYNTDHSIIVTIPSEENGFKLSAFNSDVPDEIKVVTSHGTATYSFKITAPYPKFNRIEGLYPREAGDTLKLYGVNLVDIESMYITDAMTGVLDTTVWTTVPGNHTAIEKHYDITQNHHLNSDTKAYETTSVVGAIVPAAAPDSGSLVIECAAGKVYLPYYKRPGKPFISSVSTDMPEIGETMYITGRDFVQVESVKYGDVTLTSGEFTTSASEDTIYIPFKKKPTSGSGTTITITTPGGTVSSGNFYDYATILTTFDGDATDNGWGPNASYIDAGNADGKYAQISVAKEYQQWWGTMIYFRKDWSGNMFSFSDNIPSTATADHLYLAMEVYDANSDYNNGTFWGYVRYMIQPKGDAENTYDNFKGDDYATQLGKFPDGPVLQDISGVNHKNKWYRAIVPLSKFACYTGKTLSDIKTIGLDQFRIQSINQATFAGKIDVKFDNIRVIYIP